MLVVLTAIVGFGTLYSVSYDTYLDTSNPLLTYLPHHLHLTHYFASKSNFLNVYFTKRLWAWITAAFLSLFITSPKVIRTRQRFLQYLVETGVWIVFATWFFGPSVLDRLIASTGGECVVALPSGAVVTVPQDYCFTKSTISIESHPFLFATSLVLPDSSWKVVPRLRRGHDVSGHVFLLTMAILFLSDQIRYSFARTPNSTPSGGSQKDELWSLLHKLAIGFNAVVILTAVFAEYTTSVYFHTPLEKLTGYRESLLSFYLFMRLTTSSVGCVWLCFDSTPNIPNIAFGCPTRCGFLTSRWYGFWQERMKGSARRLSCLVCSNQRTFTSSSFTTLLYM